MFEIAIKLNAKIKPINQNDFGLNLKLNREYLGLSQQQLANMIKLNDTTINDLENHKRYNTSIITIRKLLTIFKEDDLLDDYTRFILNQKEEFIKLKKYKGQIIDYLKIDRGTYHNWTRGLYQLKHENYIKIKELLE